MPNARPQWRCQAPQPRSGAPKAQGLIAALWSQPNPACRRSLQTAAPTQTTVTGAVALMATSAPAVKLHLLDGRDPCQEAIREAPKTLRGIKSFWIKNAECIVENDRISMYRVNGKISF